MINEAKQINDPYGLMIKSISYKLQQVAISLKSFDEDSPS